MSLTIVRICGSRSTAFRNASRCEGGKSSRMGARSVSVAGLFPEEELVSTWRFSGFGESAEVILGECTFCLPHRRPQVVPNRPPVVVEVAAGTVCHAPLGPKPYLSRPVCETGQPPVEGAIGLVLRS